MMAVVGVIAPWPRYSMGYCPLFNGMRGWEATIEAVREVSSQGPQLYSPAWLNSKHVQHSVNQSIQMNTRLAHLGQRP